MRLDARLVLSMAASRRAPEMARSAGRAAECLLPDRRAGDMALLVSELVTNAVLHPQYAGHNRVTLELVIFDDLLRVEVGDRGVGFTPPPPPAPGQLHGVGWGLYLLDALADRWGIARGRGLVWFEILLPRGDDTG